MVVRGMSDAGNKWNNNNAAQQALVKAAIQSLNDLNDPTVQVMAQADAQTKVNAILTNLNQAIANLPGAPAALAAASRPIPSVTELQIKNQQLNKVAWIAWFIVTLTIGYYVMIATFPGFGTYIDLWKCFFWGLSIPMVGQQLQQLNPSTISTTLNFAVPKA